MGTLKVIQEELSTDQDFDSKEQEKNLSDQAPKRFFKKN